MNKAIQLLRSIATNADPFTEKRIANWIEQHTLELGYQATITPEAIKHGSKEESHRIQLKSVTYELGKQAVAEASVTTVQPFPPYNSSFKETSINSPEALLVPEEYGLLYITRITVVKE